MIREQVIVEFISNINMFVSQLTTTHEEFLQLAKNVNTVSNRWATLGTRIRLMTHGLRGFRMEMLGVMFFGMMMANTFQAMLKPAMEVFGVFSLWTDTLTVLFLPIMAQIFPYILGFMEWLMNLPEPTKMAIGVITLLGFALGKLLFVVGSLALGLGSLFQVSMFTKLISGIAKVLTTILGLGATVLAVLTVIAIGIYLAWRTNFMRIKEFIDTVWAGIKLHFSGLFNYIKGILKVITSLINGDFEGVVDGFKLMLKGLKDMFLGTFNIIYGIVMTVAIGIIRIIVGVVQSVVNGAIWGLNKLIDLANKIPGVEINNIGSVDWVGKMNGIGGGTAYSPTYNIQVSDKAEMRKLLEEHDKEFMRDIKSGVKV